MRNPKKSASKIIIVVLACIVVSLSLVSTALAQNTVVKAEASTTQAVVGHNLTVNIKISDVQNLFGVDVTLSWNTTVLHLVSATSQLGVESHPGGVLHETSADPIEVIDDTALQSTGEYHLLATSTGSASPFSGSGTIATVTFNVVTAGSAGLSLTSELSDHPAYGGTSNLIDHTDTVDSVNAVVSGSSSTPGSSPSPTVPEFPNLAGITILLVVAVAAIGFLTKVLGNKGRLRVKSGSEF